MRTAPKLNTVTTLVVSKLKGLPPAFRRPFVDRAPVNAASQNGDVHLLN